MRGLTSTLILVVVLAGLGAYIYFVDSKRPAASADGSSAEKEKVFTAEVDKINEVRVTYKGESTLLKKSEGGWKLVEPAQVDADPTEAIGVATALTNVDIVRVVDENATNLEQFGLANPNITVEYKSEGGGSGTLRLGNKNATQGEIYALKDDSKRVFLVSAFQETSFNRTPFDLRDKKILKFDRDKADSLVLARGTTSLELGRSGTEWKVTKPVASRSDYSAIEGFISRLSSANMSKMLEENPKDLAKYGLDKPSMTVTIGAGSAKTVLEIGKTENGDTYARDAARPIIFTVDSTLQTDLNKSFDDYRKKELFEFRPFYVDRLRAVLDSPGGAKTYEFEKVKGAQPADPETWKVTRVGGASHTADQAAMDDLLNKLITIKAESFVEGKAATGLDKPALVVSASFDDGKFERVRFGQVGDNAYGKRDGEDVIATIEHMSMRAALQAFDAVVMAPEAKTETPKGGREEMTRRGCVFLTTTAFFVLLTGCASSGSRPPTLPAAPATHFVAEQLRRDLAAIFSESSIDHAVWGVSVRSLKHDDTLFALNASRMQTPASTMKLVTSAVAAEKLGWDYRYSTRIYATGPLTDGDLDGDLVIVSNGDPTINPRHPERWGAFDAWAKQLYTKGVRRVGGQLIGDDNAFAEPGWGVGWAWDDLSAGYGTAVGALQYNENELELLIGPGSEPGARAIISVSPPGSGIILDHAVTTVAEGQPSRISLDRIPGTNMLRVSGQMAVGAPAVSRSAAVPNPTILYLNALREALARNGVFIGGTPLDIDDARVKPDYGSATLLLEDRSPALASIIDVCLKWSRNEYAETMLRSLAPSTGEATADGGLDVVRDTLSKWGVASELYVARDGSGLSRNDYLSPDVLTAVLTAIWRDPRHVDAFRSALPVAGVSGTLANQLKDTAASGRVWAKTGSMSNVRSLSGYLMTLDDEPIVFTLMATGFHVPAAQIDAVMNQALLRLVRYPRDLHEE